MSFSKILTNFITKILESGAGPTYVYRDTEESRGKLKPEEVLKIIEPAMAQENELSRQNSSLLKPLRPILQENEETGNLHWQAAVFYERRGGERFDENDIYLWFIVDDATGTIIEKIYAR